MNNPQQQLSSPTYCRLIGLLRSDDDNDIARSVSEIVDISRRGTRSPELIQHGVIPALVNLLSDSRNNVTLRVKVAAALCNLLQESSAHASFAACDAVRLVVQHVVTDHQALTGATALMFSHMIRSNILVQQMLQNHVASTLLQGLMNCTNEEINKAVVDSLCTVATKRALQGNLVAARGVEVCIYYLHTLTRGHYFTDGRERRQIARHRERRSDDPAFVKHSSRDPLVATWKPVVQQAGTRDSARSSEDNFSGGDSTPRKVGYVVRRLSREVEPEIQYFRVRKETPPEEDIEVLQKRFVFKQDDMQKAEGYMKLLMRLLSDSLDASDRLMRDEMSLDIIAYWLKYGNVIVRQISLRILRKLVRLGQRHVTTRRDLIQRVAQILDEPGIGEIGINELKQGAALTIYEMCDHGGDSVRISSASEGVVVRLLNVLGWNDCHSAVHYTVLRTLHSLARCSLPRAQIATSGGLPKLLRLLRHGMEFSRGSPTAAPSQSQSPDQPDTPQAASPMTPEGSPYGVRLHHELSDDYPFYKGSLEYCTAILRSFAATQSPDYVDDLLEIGAVPTMLEAVKQEISLVVRKHALGFLANLSTIHHGSGPVQICLEGGCTALLSLRQRAENREIEEPENWVAWTSLALYHLLQNPECRSYVRAAAARFWRSTRDNSLPALRRQFQPDKYFIDLDWIESL